MSDGDYPSCASCHTLVESGDAEGLAARHAQAVKRASLAKHMPDWAIAVSARDLADKLLAARTGESDALGPDKQG